MHSQIGQAAVEWVTGVMLATLCFGAAVTAAVRVDGRALGGLLAHRLACSVQGACRDGDADLERAYGDRDAAFVRRNLPGLVYEPGELEVPVDWRHCRDVACATASDDIDLDVHRTASGHPVTVFTRLVRRSGRRYVQYWFYYPDSNTVLARSDQIWKRSRLLQFGGLVLRGSAGYPGYHHDDWEGASVREGPHGVSARVTSHGHWQWCKWSACKGEWGPFAGWTRVSRGSHSGHLPARARRRWGWPLTPPKEFELQRPGIDFQERTSTPDGIRLVPLETLDRRSYRRLDDGIAPPWLKEAYHDPESPDS